MQSFSRFHSTHFQEVEKRNYFAQQIRASLQQYQQEGERTDSTEHENQESDPWLQLPNESVDQWQNRHGFFHLTPEGVKMFDETRKKREQLQEMLAAETQSLDLREIKESRIRSTESEDVSSNSIEQDKIQASIAAFRRANSSNPLQSSTISTTTTTTESTEALEPLSELDLLRKKALAGMKRSRQSSASDLT